MHSAPAPVYSDPSSPFSVHQTMISVVCSCLAFLVLSVFIYKHLNKPILPGNLLPPGPRRLPFIGNLHQITNPIHKSLHRLAELYGPLMYLRLGSVPTIIVSSSDVVRDIFQNHDLVFSGRPCLYAGRKLSYNCSDIVLAPYGQKWREMRKIATIELLSTKRVQSFKSVREEEVKLMIDSIDKNLSSSGPINLSKLTLSLSNNVVCRVAFGRKYDDGFNGESRLDSLLGQAQELLEGFCIADFYPWMEWLCKFNGLEDRLQKTFRELDELYDTIIKEHLDPMRSKSEHEDFVDVLLRLQKGAHGGPALSNDSIKGAVTDMFIAGTDTSSAAIIWTMTELIRNPQVMNKVQEEIRRIVHGKARVEESDLSEFHYLKLVLKESFRVHPPAPLLVPRETTEATRIRGYEIPSKTRVFVNAWSMSLDSKSWENPNEFRPERFLGSSTDLGGQNFELIPFGVGRRACPGMGFSLALVELALANLLYRYDWKLPHGVGREDVDMEEASGITMHKKTHLFLIPIPATNL